MYFTFMCSTKLSDELCKICPKQNLRIALFIQNFDTYRMFFDLHPLLMIAKLAVVICIDSLDKLKAQLL